MQKLNVEKDEAVADIIERVLESHSDEVLLVVPKRSRLIESANNFRLLAREAKVLGKSIRIESVDEKVLELAKVNGLASTHPLFDDVGANAVSDILLRPEEGPKPRAKRGAVALKVEKEEEAAEAEDDDDAEEAEDAIDYREVAEEEEETPEEVEEESYETLRPRRRSSRKYILVTAGIIGLLLLLAWGANVAFGRSTVTIRFKAEPWTAREQVTATTAAKSADVSKGIIPAQLFEEQKTLSQAFPATGRANVSEKARGTITIVNAYSSDSQSWVAATRFETPDGKIYRLDNPIVVPGAKIENGKVTPVSIKAQVTADGAGPSYNVGRVDKLTMPAFKGTPKFEGFYGVLESGAAGGFSGEKAVATDADVAKAEKEVRDVMRQAFTTTFLGGIPSDIKILEEGRSMQVTKISAERTTDAGGNFSVSATALFQAFGIREGDVVALLDAKAKQANASKAIKEASLKYVDPVANLSAKELKFTVEAEGSLVPAFDAEDFESKILGKKEKEARELVVGLPDLASADIRMRPSWLRRIPEDAAKVDVKVE